MTYSQKNKVPVYTIDVFFVAVFKEEASYVCAVNG